MDPRTPGERRALAQAAAHQSWAKTADRTARTAAARRTFLERFEREVDPDGVLPPEERAKRATSARSAYFAKLTAQRAASQRVKKKMRN